MGLGLELQQTTSSAVSWYWRLPRGDNGPIALRTPWLLELRGSIIAAFWAVKPTDGTSHKQ